MDRGRRPWFDGSALTHVVATVRDLILSGVERLPSPYSFTVSIRCDLNHGVVFTHELPSHWEGQPVANRAELGPPDLPSSGSAEFQLCPITSKQRRTLTGT
jgi:hypothetical protein